MNFLTPILAGVAAAVLIPSLLLLYFLKLRRRDVEVSTTLLWKKAIQDLQANAPFQKLRRNILLLLQLLALAAGLLALAQPEMSSRTTSARRSVILIDRSASMSTFDEPDGPSRLERAKRDALEFVESLREPGLLGVGDAEEAMVIAFDASAEVVQSFTSDKARLRAAIESIEETDATSSLVEAMRLAGAHIAPPSGADAESAAARRVPVHLWSDGRIPDLDETRLPAGALVRYHRAGESDTTNVGVTAVRAERAFDEPGKISVFVGLQSTSAAPTAVEVELAIDGLVRGIKEVQLPAASAGEPAAGGVVFNLDRPEGGVARVRLTGDDPLAADDRAWLVLAPAKRLSVALVSTGNLFLQSALEGLNLSRLEVMSGAEFERAVDRGDYGQFDVVVLDGWIPQDGALPPGRYVVFGAAPALRDVSPTGTAREGPFVIIDWSRDHPTLRHAEMGNVVLSSQIPLEVGEEARVLARSDLGPAIVEATETGVRAVMCSFGAAESNWPFEPGFVVFLAASVRHLGEEGAATAGEIIRPGETVSTRLPQSVSQATLTAPGAPRRTLAASPDGRIVFGPVREAGLYALRWAGEPGPGDVADGDQSVRPIAVSLLSPDESNVGAAADFPLASQTDAEGETVEREAPMRLWPWLLGAVIAIAMFEWFIYNRRVQL